MRASSAKNQSLYFVFTFICNAILLQCGMAALPQVKNLCTSMMNSYGIKSWSFVSWLLPWLPKASASAAVSHQQCTSSI